MVRSSALAKSPLPRKEFDLSFAPGRFFPFVMTKTSFTAVTAIVSSPYLMASLFCQKPGTMILYDRSV